MNLRAIYKAHSAAHTYIIGFVNKHEQVVYSFRATFDQLLPFIVDSVTDRERYGDEYPSLRYRVQRGQRDKLEAGMYPNWERLESVHRICTESELKAWANANGKNLGEAFEVLACERLGLKQNPNPTEAWYDGPDAWDADGTPIQIGYEGKTFTYTAQVEKQGWAE